jgi:hypothetical protein
MNNEEQGQTENLVVVFRAQDEVTANIVLGLLVGEDIPALVQSRMVPWMDGVMKMGEGYWGDVLVPGRFASASRSLIEAYQKQQPIEPED